MLKVILWHTVLTRTYFRFISVVSNHVFFRLFLHAIVLKPTVTKLGNHPKKHTLLRMARFLAKMSMEAQLFVNRQAKACYKLFSTGSIHSVYSSFAAIKLKLAKKV